MNNPFYYGQIAKGNDFTDRKKEIKELTRDLENGGRIFIISPRRYGKTSLSVNILERLKRKNVFTVYFDVYNITTLEQFIAHYARAIARASLTKTESIIQFIRDVIPALRPNIKINSDGEISIGIEASSSKNELSLLIKDILDIPQKIAAKKGKKFVIVFDEFQEIRAIGGDALEKMMRASFQHQKDVGYIFAGSKQHIMSDMVLNKNKPFYKMGRILFLDKIPTDDLREFIRIKFTASQKSINDKILNDILKISRSITYYTLHLCHEIWNESIDSKIIMPDIVPIALEKITSGLSPLFVSTWDSLTLAQRQLLQVIAVFGGRDLFSKDFINGHRLGSASSVQKSIKLLIKKDVLEKENGGYQFTDIWFMEWVKKKSA
ncbi:MAG: ATP-binding protein [Elusimicrobia bacterium]|nr:ATP-binding protein [Elusimicrobiota bacterium]